MPAYTMETPVPYAMESGSPHARYALLHRSQHGWQVEHIQVPYAWEQAAQVARGNQRADWAQWLAPGPARYSAASPPSRLAGFKRPCPPDRGTSQKRLGGQRGGGTLAGARATERA